MVEFDPTVPVIGPGGPVPFLDLFEGREELVVYSTCGGTAHRIRVSAERRRPSPQTRLRRRGQFFFNSSANITMMPLGPRTYVSL